MDGLVFDVENMSARPRAAGIKSAQPLQMSNGGFPASAGKQAMQTPRRRALGDITNGRGNTPKNASKTPGVGLRKPLAVAAAAASVQPHVEEVDTAKRMGDEEQPFSDAWFEEGVEALNRFANSQTRLRSTNVPALPTAPPPPTPSFEGERFRDGLGDSDDDGAMDMVLISGTNKDCPRHICPEEDGEGGAFADFSLDLSPSTD